MSVALVHDYLLVMRGAERTFAAMADAWPGADIHTLLYDEEATGGYFADRSVSTSYLQRLGGRQHNFRRMLPLFPRAAERLSLGGYDLVVSSSSAFAHGVRPSNGAVHVCYCHSPFRYAWHSRRQALEEMPRTLRPLLGRTLDRIRAWDREVAQRVTHYVANSEVTRARLNDFYGREATVVHPPVDVDRFFEGRPDRYALMVTELVRHKRVDLALEAARRAGLPVKVVGTGPDLARLRAEYGASAAFLGRVPDPELVDLYANARVFLMANVEEFGIAAVEAQAAGRPVVAAAAGGALETVVPGVTGVLVPVDDVDAMAEALTYTDFDRFDPGEIRRHAQRFSTQAFIERLHSEVTRLAGRPSVERDTSHAGALSGGARLKPAVTGA